MNRPQKIFIIGLPRTGTTSLCSTMLDLDFSVAHTAYTQNTFDDAEVIADTPIFCDYRELDICYPNSKFIYLNRNCDVWLPSIKQLLLRMHTNIVRLDGGFNPIIKRCYQSVFSPFTLENISEEPFLRACYKKHRNDINIYFKDREEDLLTIEIDQEDSYQQLISFLKLEYREGSFTIMNSKGKITAWNDLKHINKVASTLNGKINKLNYLNK